MSLGPFPVDDATLDMLEAAVDPWAHGEHTAEASIDSITWRWSR